MQTYDPFYWLWSPSHLILSMWYEDIYWILFASRYLILHQHFFWPIRPPYVILIVLKSAKILPFFWTQSLCWRNIGMVPKEFTSWLVWGRNQIYCDVALQYRIHNKLALTGSAKLVDNRHLKLTVLINIMCSSTSLS